jgi:mannose-6-phosphate isomerase-like protein (cupin superfamily)
MKDEYAAEEGCFIRELLNTHNDPAVSVARARVPPGITTKRHRIIGTEERYVIIQGSGWMSVGELKPHRVRAEDVIRIPAGTMQSISNVGKKDLIFLCVCTPRFEHRNYELLE